MDPNDTTEDTADRGFASTATFGPAFFLGQLRAFARECCPNPSEGLPCVTLHLATGEVLQLCHVLGLAPAFVGLAVLDDVKGSSSGCGTAMRTEIVPYALIARVTIRQRGGSGAHVGFNVAHAPQLLPRDPSPEEMLRVASRAPPGRGEPTTAPRPHDGADDHGR